MRAEQERRKMRRRRRRRRERGVAMRKRFLGYRCACV